MPVILAVGCTNLFVIAFRKVGHVQIGWILVLLLGVCVRTCFALRNVREREEEEGRGGG